MALTGGVVVLFECVGRIGLASKAWSCKVAYNGWNSCGTDLSKVPMI